MKKEKIIKMLSSAFDEIGRLRVENRRLIEETKELAEMAEAAAKKLDAAHEANAEMYRALQQAEKSKEKAEMALKLANANAATLAKQTVDLAKERDAALRRAEKAEDGLKMRSEGKERIATVAVLPRNDGEEALLTAAEKNYAPTPLSETAEAGTRDKTYADIWHSWLAEKIKGKK